MQSRDKIVVVDDDRAQARLIESQLQAAGYEVATFHSGEECLRALTDVLPLAVCLDLHMPGLSGLQTLAKILERNPSLPVLILTSDDQTESVVEATKAGAYDYLTKPVLPDVLLHRVHNAVERFRLSLRVTGLERESAGHRFAELVGTSAVMTSLFRQMDRLALSDITTLLCGESGTGKELVAQAIHAHSSRRKGAFVAVNCAAIPDTLQESELFGHERGAFTGATDRRIGRFEQADGGTLFLDEIAELSASAQAKLLRVLQERTFTRVGGRQDISSDFRLIGATHRNLQELVEAGDFREDLYYRVAVYEVEIPPLRDRGDDVELLAGTFLDRFSEAEDRQVTLSREVLHCLRSYDWPGNVRELQNAVQRAVVASDGPTLALADLPPRLRAARGTDRGPAETAATMPPASDDVISLVDATGRSRPLEDLERAAIQAAIARHDGNLSQVCRQLGMGRTTLYRKLKRYGIDTEAATTDAES